MKTSDRLLPALTKRINGSRNANLAGAVGTFLLAAVALFISFWVIYVVIYFGFDWLWPHSHRVRLGISAGVLLLLFIGNAFGDSSEDEMYSFTSGTHGDTPVSITIPFVGTGSMANPLAPDSVHSYAKFITSILYTGPRIATDGFRMIGKARRLARIDIAACASVIAFVAEQSERVPFEEVVTAVPRGRDPAAILEQLQEIDGVMFVRAEPAGMSLHSDFRDEMCRLLPPRRKKQPSSDEATEAEM